MTTLSRRKKAAFAATVAVAVLVAAETVLRLFDFSFYFNFSADLLGMPLLDLHKLRRAQNRTVDFDPYLFWKFKPDQKLDRHGVYRKPVTINSRGFRGSDFDIEKPDGVYRVVCIGDSTTFGWSVGDDETFAVQLERMLNRHCGEGRAEVINLGVTGYTSLQGRELMNRFAARLEPDLVVFAFGANDRLPALKSDEEHLRSGTWARSKLNVFLHEFQVYKLLASAAVYLGNRARGLSLDPKTFIPLLKHKVSPAEFAANIKEVKRAADEIGAVLVVIHVDYPSLPPDHVHREIERMAREAGADMPVNFAAWTGNEAAVRAAREAGAPEFDLRPLFAEKIEEIQKARLEPERAEKMRQAMGERLAREPWWYLMVDNGHPNEWGHQIIARELFSIARDLPGFPADCREAP